MFLIGLSVTQNKPVKRSNSFQWSVMAFRHRFRNCLWQDYAKTNVTRWPSSRDRISVVKEERVTNGMSRSNRSWLDLCVEWGQAFRPRRHHRRRALSSSSPFRQLVGLSATATSETPPPLDRIVWLTPLLRLISDLSTKAPLSTTRWWGLLGLKKLVIAMAETTPRKALTFGGCWQFHVVTAWIFFFATFVSSRFTPPREKT